VNATILQAIASRRRLRFTYHDRERLIEPQCYGAGRRGTELLRAHQLSGGTQREPLFNVAEIERLVMLDEAVHPPRAELQARRLGDGDDLRAALTPRVDRQAAQGT